MAKKRKKQVQEPSCRPLFKGDVMLAVIRPEDPDKALAEVRRIQQEQEAGQLSPQEAEREFNLITTKQTYRYAGIAGEDGKTLLCHANPTIDDAQSQRSSGLRPIEGDHIRPGDSFVPYVDLMKMMSQGQA